MIIKEQIASIISAELRASRSVLGLTQEGMAHHLWIGLSEYQSLEKKRIKDPRLSTALKIALRLGWSMDKMFGMDGQAHNGNAFEIK